MTLFLSLYSPTLSSPLLQAAKKNKYLFFSISFNQPSFLTRLYVLVMDLAMLPSYIYVYTNPFPSIHQGAFSFNKFFYYIHFQGAESVDRGQDIRGEKGELYWVLSFSFFFPPSVLFA